MKCLYDKEKECIGEDNNFGGKTCLGIQLLKFPVSVHYIEEWAIDDYRKIKCKNYKVGLVCKKI